MKIKVSSKKDEGFVPYTVVFEINNREESARFHNKVATKGITGGAHEFIGHIFRRGNEGLDEDYECEL